MKRIAAVAIVLILFPLPLVSQTTLELTAIWNPSPEADVSHYNLYLLHEGDCTIMNDDPIIHPLTSYTFELELPEDSRDVLCFAVTAVDLSGNESGFSEEACLE